MFRDKSVMSLVATWKKLAIALEMSRGYNKEAQDGGYKN